MNQTLESWWRHNLFLIFFKIILLVREYYSFKINIKFSMVLLYFHTFFHITFFVLKIFPLPFKSKTKTLTMISNLDLSMPVPDIYPRTNILLIFQANTPPRILGCLKSGSRVDLRPTLEGDCRTAPATPGLLIIREAL